MPLVIGIDPGTISIDICGLENGHLVLVVSDDGPGIAARPAQPGSGTGLSNTRERLAQLYGAEGDLRIESAAAGGTTVRIRIPVSRTRGAGVHHDG